MTESATSDEAELVRLAKRGDAGARSAFDMLVEMHQERLIRLMRHLVGGSEAEDVAQEAFVRAYLAISRIHTDAPFWPWLRTIATRLAYNRRRDRKTRRGYEDRIEMKCGALSPLSDSQAITRVFDDLSYPYREVLLLRYVEEMSIDEIATSLRLGESATKMRLKRARQEFKQVFERVTR